MKKSIKFLNSESVELPIINMFTENRPNMRKKIDFWMKKFLKSILHLKDATVLLKFKNPSQIEVLKLALNVFRKE